MYDKLKNNNNNANYLVLQTSKKSPEFKKLVEDFSAKLSKVVSDINASVPNAKESTAELQKQFQTVVDTVIKESDSLTKTLKDNSGNIKEDIANFTKKVVDTVVESTQKLNEQLKAAEKKN